MLNFNNKVVVINFHFSQDNRERGGTSQTPFYLFHPLHIHFNICRAIIAENSAHIDNNRNRSGNPCFRAWVYNHRVKRPFFHFWQILRRTCHLTKIKKPAMSGTRIRIKYVSPDWWKYSALNRDCEKIQI